MSLFDGFNTIRLVKVGPSLRQRIERRIAAAHHNLVIARLRHFREQLEREMHPESWLDLQAPLVAILADLCDALGLDDAERAGVLGCDGTLALADILETPIRPVLQPRLPINQRQAKALAYAREHGQISIAIYRQLCPHWSNETLRLDLSNLVARGLLLKNGAKKGTHYTLAP